MLMIQLYTIDDLSILCIRNERQIFPMLILLLNNQEMRKSRYNCFDMKQHNATLLQKKTGKCECGKTDATYLPFFYL